MIILRVMAGVMVIFVDISFGGGGGGVISESKLDIFIGYF